MLEEDLIPPEPLPLETFLHRVFPTGKLMNAGTDVAQTRHFAPRKGAEPIRVDPPIDWEMASSTDRNARMQLQGWTMFHPIMNAFDAAPDRQMMLDFFFEVVGDWWRNYSGDADDIVTTRTPESYAWYDMSVGFRSLILAYFFNRIDLHGCTMSGDQRLLLRETALKHVRHLRCPAVFYPNNHGIFQMHGLRALAETQVYSEADEDKRYAERNMSALVKLQFDNQGVHREHSPHYHFYASRVFRAVVASGWYGTETDLAATIRRARNVEPWLVDPDGRCVAVGDSIPTRQAGIVIPGEKSGEGRSEGLITSSFDGSGYSVARSPWNQPAEDSTYLFLTGGYHSRTHKHRDCLSFEWYHAGHKRVADSGKYGYWANEYRRYVLSSRAHNSVEVEGFDILKLTPYGTAIESTEILEDGTYHGVGNLRYPAVWHHRDLFMSTLGWIILVDQVEFNRVRSATQWIHLASGHTPTPVVPAGPERTTRSGQGTSFLGPDGRELHIECVSGGAKMDVIRGATDPYQGYLSEHDDHIEPGYAVGFNIAVKGGRLVTILAVGEEALLSARAFVEAGVRDGQGSRSQGAARSEPSASVGSAAYPMSKWRRARRRVAGVARQGVQDLRRLGTEIHRWRH